MGEVGQPRHIGFCRISCNLTALKISLILYPIMNTKEELFENCVQQFVKLTQKKFGQSLKCVILFGSTVKNLKVKTDIDLFVILENDLAKEMLFQFMDDAENELRPFLAVAKAAGFEWAPSIKLKSKRQALKFNPLYLDWIQTSRVLYADAENLDQVILTRTKAFIQKYGSKRIEKGLFWYWDICPGLTYSEVIEYQW